MGGEGGLSGGPSVVSQALPLPPPLPFPRVSWPVAELRVTLPSLARLPLRPHTRDAPRTCNPSSSRPSRKLGAWPPGCA